MALTGNTVQSTYLDLVQLEKSGAGLPSHAGKEAALYDGAGNQIIGRTAVRHWLDPHPDAASFAETWEFSTKGTMTQAALETAGWTFSNMTGSVTGGGLLLTHASTGATDQSYIGCNLTGDFDIVTTMEANISYGAKSPSGTYLGAFGAVDTVNNTYDGIHLVITTSGNGRSRYGVTYSTGAGGTLGTNEVIYRGTPCLLRISRVSGTIYFWVGSPHDTYFQEDQTGENTNVGFIGCGSVANGNAINRISFNGTNMQAVASGSSFRVLSIRRFQ